MPECPGPVRRGALCHREVRIGAISPRQRLGVDDVVRREDLRICVFELHIRRALENLQRLFGLPELLLPGSFLFLTLRFGIDAENLCELVDERNVGGCEGTAVGAEQCLLVLLDIIRGSRGNRLTGRQQVRQNVLGREDRPPLVDQRGDLVVILELGADVREIVGGEEVAFERLGAALVDPGDLSTLGDDIDEPGIVRSVEIRVGEQRGLAGRGFRVARRHMKGPSHDVRVHVGELVEEDIDKCRAGPVVRLARHPCPPAGLADHGGRDIERYAVDRDGRLLTRGGLPVLDRTFEDLDHVLGPLDLLGVFGLGVDGLDARV